MPFKLAFSEASSGPISSMMPDAGLGTKTTGRQVVIALPCQALGHRCFRSAPQR